MKEKKLVTLEELEGLFAKEASWSESDIPVQRQGGRKPVLEPTMFGSTLSRHLYAERLLQKDYRKVDWANECPLPDLISVYAETWMRPLVWQDTCKYQNMVIDGRVAEEEYYYNYNRYIEISEIVNYIYEQVILAYADEPIDYDEDQMEVKIPKGIHEWRPLMWNVKGNLNNILEGIVQDKDTADDTFYNCAIFRYNLNIIAKHRGGEKATQLLKMLQDEWPKIKLWKIGFDKMDEKDIAEFEEQLFHGFDDLLEQWDAETPKAPASAPAKPRGPKTQYLFADVRGNEDTSRTKTEAERVRKFVADHHMGNMQLDSKATNRLNLLVACFWYRWNERKWVSQEPQGAAIYRFFTEQCGLKCAVLQKAFSTKICNIINAGKKDYQIYDDLDSYFRE